MRLEPTQAKIRECGLGLRPRLNAGPVCEGRTDAGPVCEGRTAEATCSLWQYIGEPLLYLYIIL